MKLRKRIEEEVRKGTGIADMHAQQALDVAQCVLFAVRQDMEKNEPRAVTTINHLKEADDYLAICLGDKE
jgi:hypothetical protein